MLGLPAHARCWPIATPVRRSDDDSRRDESPILPMDFITHLRTVLREVVLDRELELEVVHVEAVAVVLAPAELELAARSSVLRRVNEQVHERVVADVKRIWASGRPSCRSTRYDQPAELVERSFQSRSANATRPRTGSASPSIGRAGSVVSSGTDVGGGVVHVVLDRLAVDAPAAGARAGSNLRFELRCTPQPHDVTVEIGSTSDRGHPI